MSYPHWAPACLMQEKDDPLFSRLIDSKDERGRELWETLRRQNGYAEDTSPRRYALGCLSALMDTDRTSLISPHQYDKHVQKISQTTQALIDLLTWETDVIGDSAQDPATYRAIEFATPEPFKFLYSNMLLVEAITKRPYSPHLPVVGAPSTPQSIIFNARDAAELQRKQLEEEHKERIQAWRRKWSIPTPDEDEDYESQISKAADDDFPMGRDLPVTAESILASLSRANVLTILEKVLHEAEAFINHEGSFYLKQPKAANARIHVFVRHLHEQHMVQFGRPLWDALALATSIILQLPDTLSADNIRPIVEGVRK